MGVTVRSAALAAVGAGIGFTVSRLYGPAYAAIAAAIIGFIVSALLFRSSRCLGGGLPGAVASAAATTVLVSWSLAPLTHALGWASPQLVDLHLAVHTVGYAGFIAAAIAVALYSHHMGAALEVDREWRVVVAVMAAYMLVFLAWDYVVTAAAPVVYSRMGIDAALVMAGKLPMFALEFLVVALLAIDYTLVVRPGRAGLLTSTISALLAAMMVAISIHIAGEIAGVVGFLVGAPTVAEATILSSLVAAQLALVPGAVSAVKLARRLILTSPTGGRQSA